MYLLCCVSSTCVTTRVTAQTSSKPTHTLQAGAEVRQEGVQHPLLVKLGTALYLLHADAAQRVTAGPRLRTGSWQPSRGPGGLSALQNGPVIPSTPTQASRKWLPVCVRESGVTAGVSPSDGLTSSCEGQLIVQLLFFRIREESLSHQSEVNAAVHLLRFWQVRKTVTILDGRTHTHTPH